MPHSRVAINVSAFNGVEYKHVRGGRDGDDPTCRKFNIFLWCKNNNYVLFFQDFQNLMAANIFESVITMLHGLSNARQLFQRMLQMYSECECNYYH